MPFLRFDAAGQERFDGWRADLEQRLRAEDDHPVLLLHLVRASAHGDQPDRSIVITGIGGS